MKKCAKCGYPNPDERTTCFKCDTELERSAAALAGSQQADDSAQTQGQLGAASGPLGTNVGTCPRCGTAAGPQAHFCPNCSSALDPARMASTNLWAPSLAVAAVLLALAVAFTALSLRSTREPEAASDAPSEDVYDRMDDPKNLAATEAAVQALEALASAVRSGLNISQYFERKADARVALDRYVSGSGSDSPARYDDGESEDLVTAMDPYDAAGELWRRSITVECSSRSIDVLDPVASRLIEEYPELKTCVHYGRLYVDEALSEIWTEAEMSVKAAREKLEDRKQPL